MAALLASINPESLPIYLFAASMIIFTWLPAKIFLATAAFNRPNISNK